MQMSDSEIIKHVKSINLNKIPSIGYNQEQYEAVAEEAQKLLLSFTEYHPPLGMPDATKDSRAWWDWLWRKVPNPNTKR